MDVSKRKRRILVSIIIINFNYADFLRDAIDSAINQKYKNLELIIVDDGSTDSSKDIILSYNKAIIKVFKKNGGQNSACNAGFRESSGDIILFLDADDYLYDDAIEDIVSIWDENISKVHFRLDKKNEKGYLGPIPAYRNKLAEGNVGDILFEKGMAFSPPMSGNAFARKTLEVIMPLPENDIYGKHYSDNYLQIKSAFYGSWKAINNTKGVYRVHDESVMNKRDVYEASIGSLKRANYLFPFFEEQAGLKGIKLKTQDFLFKNPDLLRCRVISFKSNKNHHIYKDDNSWSLFKLIFVSCLNCKSYRIPRRIYELLITLKLFFK